MRSSRLCVIIIQGIGTDRIECHGLARMLCLLVFLIVRLPFLQGRMHFTIVAVVKKAWPSRGFPFRVWGLESRGFITASSSTSFQASVHRLACTSNPQVAMKVAVDPMTMKKPLRRDFDDNDVGLCPSVAWPALVKRCPKGWR